MTTRKFQTEIVVSHKFVISFHNLHINAWKMWNASYGLLLSLPIIHYFQIKNSVRRECLVSEMT